MRAYGLRFLRIQKHTYARKTRNVYISSLDDVFWRIPAIATSGGAVLKLWNAFRTNDGRGISAETVFIKNNSGATFCFPFSTVVFGVKFETKSTQVSADKSTPHTCAFVAGEFSIPKKKMRRSIRMYAQRHVERAHYNNRNEHRRNESFYQTQHLRKGKTNPIPLSRN